MQDERPHATDVRISDPEPSQPACSSSKFIKQTKTPWITQHSQNPEAEHTRVGVESGNSTNTCTNSTRQEKEIELFCYASAGITLALHVRLVTRIIYSEGSSLMRYKYRIVEP